MSGRAWLRQVVELFRTAAWGRVTSTIEFPPSFSLPPSLPPCFSPYHGDAHGRQAGVVHWRGREGGRGGGGRKEGGGGSEGGREGNEVEEM